MINRPFLKDIEEAKGNNKKVRQHSVMLALSRLKLYLMKLCAPQVLYVLFSGFLNNSHSHTQLALNVGN